MTDPAADEQPEQVSWAGPGQWRSHASRVQQPLTPAQEAEIEAGPEPDVAGITAQLRQAE